MTSSTILHSFRHKLTGRLFVNDIHEICFLTQGEENNPAKEILYRLIKDNDQRIAYNALWVFNHFDLSNNQWLYTKQNELIELVMQETHEGKKRLLLTLLLRQPFHKESLRTDFLDFCLAGIVSTIRVCSIRALCMKLAYEQCKHHPELTAELTSTLEMIADEPLSPGLSTARRNLLKKIAKKHTIYSDL